MLRLGQPFENDFCSAHLTEDVFLQTFMDQPLFRGKALEAVAMRAIDLDGSDVSAFLGA
jgi:hypothetical protein